MRDSVLVTGGTGFIGRRLVASLLDQGVKVRVMTRRPHAVPARAAVVPYPPDGRFTEEHLTDVDVVCHLASFVPPSMEDAQFAEDCFRINALHTLSLLTAASGRVTSFVHLSSGNIYAPASSPRSEGDLLYPDNRATHYLLSKIAGEVYASSFGKRGVFRVAILRPSSVYGPSMAPGGMLPRFLARARAGERIELADGGMFGADFVYVDDVVHAIVATIDRKAEGLFNVGSGTRTTARDAAVAVLRAFGAPEENISVTGDPAAGTASGFAALDIDRARAALGYAPVSLDEGLRRWLLTERSL
jgi:UDP-glucose 4-epimerase